MALNAAVKLTPQVQQPAINVDYGNHEVLQHGHANVFNQQRTAAQLHNMNTYGIHTGNLTQQPPKETDHKTADAISIAQVAPQQTQNTQEQGKRDQPALTKHSAVLHSTCQTQAEHILC